LLSHEGRQYVVRNNGRVNVAVWIAHSLAHVFKRSRGDVESGSRITRPLQSVIRRRYYVV
jgi:hypothetical protein